VDAVAAEDRLVDDDDRRRDAREQPPEVAEIGDPGHRFNARLRLEQRPERLPHAAVTGGDEHRDGRRLDRCGVRGHRQKHRPAETGPHQCVRRNRPP
jgi:hypothetical protein